MAGSSMTMAAFGVSSLGSVPVAERMNFGLFQQAPAGKRLCIGGRFKDGSFAEQLTTTDGGLLTVLADPELAKEIAEAQLKGFFEVIGTKEGESSFRASALLPLGEQVDVELWDEAVKMSHLPQLRSMFEPLA
mmetsp:Transcript_70665/g.185234  ORF Transcript_70665/g.185234 Transcript_70665/m.185234 type:complete len:133 (-) Transcript_70665:230-628(-)